MADITERLRSFEADGYPVVSLYLSLDPDPGQARSIPVRLKELLDPLEHSSQTMPRPALMSVRADVARIHGMDDDIADRLGRSVAIFACNGRSLFELVEIPIPIGDTASVGSRPYLRPLDAALSSAMRTCAVLVDKRDARFYELTIDGVEELTAVAGTEIRKDNYAGRYGLDEHPVRNHAEEVAHRQYRDIIETLASLHRQHKFDLVLIGGRSGMADEFAPFLTEALRPLVAGSFVIDSHTATPAQVGERCAPLITEHLLVHQHKVVRDIVGRAHRFDTALGLRATLEAANANAIDTLVVDRTVTVRGVSCEACGWLGIGGGRCPVCDAELEIHRDVLDELARRTLEHGGTVEHVATGHTLGDGGVVARLRFPLNLPVG